MSNSNFLPKCATTLARAIWHAALPAGLLLVLGCARPAAERPTQAPPPGGAAALPANTSSANQPAPAPAPPPAAAVAAALATADAKIVLPVGAAAAPAPFEGEGWEAIFDGKTLTGWRETEFVGHATVQCGAEVILVKSGDLLSGVNYTNDPPKMNYEVALDAMRVSGSDFFCGLTVPVEESWCSLIVGGWGGSLVGISSLDGMDASENQTTKFVTFEQGRWYRIRLRMTQGRIEAWIDKDKVVDVVTTNKRISLRPGEIDLSKPFGLAAYQTSAAFREIKLRRVTAPADPPKKSQLYD